MDCSILVFPVLYHLSETAQIHIHWVSDAIPISSFVILLPPALSLFQRVSSSHQVAKVLDLQLQPQSFQWIFRVDFLQDWRVWSCCQRDFQESFPTSQLESINSSVFSLLYGPTLTSVHDYWKKQSFDNRIFVGNVMSLIFNTESKCVIVLLPRSKHILISWLPSLSTVILEHKIMKFATFPPFICHEVMGVDAINLVFECEDFHSDLSPSQEAL